MLKVPTFIYLLNVFEYLMSHIDMIYLLYNQFQKINTDLVEIGNAIKNFEINIKKERENIHNIRVDNNYTSGKIKIKIFILQELCS